MTPKLVSFDAAGTLIRVNWNASQFAMECASEAGLELDPQVAFERHFRLVSSRWRSYQELNTTRDVGQCDRFWLDLTHDWLESLGLPNDAAYQVQAIANTKMYSPEQQLFTLYDDVIGTLERIKDANISMAVLSNWDYTLHRFIELLNLAPYFDFVFASLEEGVEKPHPDLFRIVERRTGVEAKDIIHIGDSPTDDLIGAREAGWEACLIDRRLTESKLPYYASLSDFAEAITE